MRINTWLDEYFYFQIFGLLKIKDYKKYLPAQGFSEPDPNNWLYKNFGLYYYQPTQSVGLSFRLNELQVNLYWLSFKAEVYTSFIYYDILGKLLKICKSKPIQDKIAYFGSKVREFFKKLNKLWHNGLYLGHFIKEEDRQRVFWIRLILFNKYFENEFCFDLGENHGIRN